ncbi:hypothetical protein Tdes44962_MAKER03127 [Teratosphaeria destructans]|uniref:Uncharacterized protein n=1 Tax=Teratosphaeria destructans TaxID=418781 RepID=A0A9W7W244_9PEZI|nr:hypothetical protein Tdes44962_MAKER03127 [Teratosphaeria destructans]
MGAQLSTNQETGAALVYLPNGLRDDFSYRALLRVNRTLVDCGPGFHQVDLGPVIANNSSETPDVSYSGPSNGLPDRSQIGTHLKDLPGLTMDQIDDFPDPGAVATHLKSIPARFAHRGRASKGPRGHGRIRHDRHRSRSPLAHRDHICSRRDSRDRRHLSSRDTEAGRNFHHRNNAERNNARRMDDNHHRVLPDSFADRDSDEKEGTEHKLPQSPALGSDGIIDTARDDPCTTQPDRKPVSPHRGIVRKCIVRLKLPRLAAPGSGNSNDTAPNDVNSIKRDRKDLPPRRGIARKRIVRGCCRRSGGTCGHYAL